ncbi:MAG: hypothetical protein ISP90_08970 [Nevskia sp.]|nr:hypothetical protein [Nevskia sp.]
MSNLGVVHPPAPAAAAKTAAKAAARRSKPRRAEPRWLQVLHRLYGHVAAMSVYK